MKISKILLAATALALQSSFAYAQTPSPPYSWDEGVVGPSLTYQQAADMAQKNLQSLLDRGQILFTTKFTKPEGAGRPKATQAIVPTKRKRGETPNFQRTGGPDASACAGCHSDPVIGAAGEFVANVFVSEGFESADFDSLNPQFSNERNSNTLTGDGLIELLAREITADLHSQRNLALTKARAQKQPMTVALESKGISYGQITAQPDGVLDVDKLEGIDTDLIVRPFSQKGVFTSLRQFTINALNVHHGLQADERFGLRWTGNADFDEDKIAHEMREGDVSALTLWQATLKPPGRKKNLPADWLAAAPLGEAAFENLGCASCHKPSLPLKSLIFTDPGPYDAAGTLRGPEVANPIKIDMSQLPWAQQLKRNVKGEWLVPLFGDLKRHVIVDAQVASLGNELMGQRFVGRDVFMTAELWGVGSTAPYGHRGDFTTLDEIIRAHGGEGRAAREAYIQADETTRAQLIAFLRSLVITQ